MYDELNLKNQELFCSTFFQPITIGFSFSHPFLMDPPYSFSYSIYPSLIGNSSIASIRSYPPMSI
jgi:hypothetical protein